MLFRSDKFSCPSTFGNQDWKTTYCGGLKPDYGCTDSRATNYNENKVKDPTDNDVCNPKYCNYASNVVLPECQGSGGGGGGLGDFSPVTPIDSSGGGQDATPVGGVTDPCAGKTGVQLTICKITNSNSGGVGGNKFIGMAEGIKSKDIIHTGQSFMNW